MDPLVKLAKDTAEEYIRRGLILSPPATPSPLLSISRACFVYFYYKPGRQLRGRWGQSLPQFQSLAEEIINNTLNALLKPIATAIRRPDLQSLIYEVAVLEPPERISHARQLNPHVYGLYVKSDRGKTALLLPRRPGIETPEDQIATAIREAGINPRQESFALYRFPVAYYV